MSELGLSSVRNENKSGRAKENKKFGIQIGVGQSIQRIGRRDHLLSMKHMILTIIQLCACIDECQKTN